jgi:hypothetical protein
MTDSIIKEQIKVIQRATENALKSKESALKFLTDAGIIKQSPANSPKQKGKK